MIKHLLGLTLTQVCHNDYYSLFHFSYINDLSENLKSTDKRFADDTSIIHIVKNPNRSAEILNHDLPKISE